MGFIKRWFNRQKKQDESPLANPFQVRMTETKKRPPPKKKKPSPKKAKPKPPQEKTIAPAPTLEEASSTAASSDPSVIEQSIVESSKILDVFPPLELSLKPQVKEENPPLAPRKEGKKKVGKSKKPRIVLKIKNCSDENKS